ncbi:MAG: tetratricopeptide repeat protein [Xenococcus sp. (in: cyanobacteria)]
MKQFGYYLRYFKGIEYSQNSLAIFQEIGDRKGSANALGNLGNSYLYIGKYPQAIEYYQKSLAISQEIGDRNGEANSLNNLGNAYLYIGEYPQAIKYYQQSLAIKQEIGDRSRGANSLNNLGFVYFHLGDYLKAIEYLQQSLAISQKISDHNLEAISLNNLGIIYNILGKYPKGIEYLLQSLAISHEIGDREGEGRTLINLGGTHHILQQYPQAIEYLQRSLAITQAIGARNIEAKSLNNLGVVYNILGKYPKAIEYYQQSLVISQDVGDREGEGLTLSNLGKIYEKQEQPELAIVFYKESVLVREEIRQDIRVLDKQLQESYTETVAVTYRRLADLLLSQDRIYEAQQVLELLKIQEIQDFTRSPNVREKLPKVVLLPQEAEIIKNYDQLVLFGVKIAKCEETSCSQLLALQEQRNILKQQFNQDVRNWETAIRKRNYQDDQFLKPNFFNDTANRIIQASDQYNTEPGTAVIYPLVLENKLWLLWAAKGKVIGKREITNIGRQQLNKEVVKLRGFLQDSNSDIADLQKTAQQLYEWLIEPLEEELEKGNIRHLYFSLDRGFRYIPMAALYDGEKYLIEKYTITTFTGDCLSS